MARVIPRFSVNALNGRDSLEGTGDMWETKVRYTRMAYSSRIGGLEDIHMPAP